MKQETEEAFSREREEKWKARAEFVGPRFGDAVGVVSNRRFVNVKARRVI